MVAVAMATGMEVVAREAVAAVRKAAVAEAVARVTVAAARVMEAAVRVTEAAVREVVAAVMAATATVAATVTETACDTAGSQHSLASHTYRTIWPMVKHTNPNRDAVARAVVAAGPMTAAFAWQDMC